MSVRGYVQACEWQPRGSELVADAAADAILLTVEDTTEFDDAGGVISINDQTIDYFADAVDDDAGTILVNVGLAEAATIGDPVYAVSGGQVMQDVVLFVSCGDGDDVEVRVSWEQRDYWPEGDYEDPVMVVLSDDLERIEDAPGRIPQSTELADAREEIDSDLDDIYDAANAAAAAAADAAANATTALTAANGKNKVTYSLSSPGSTANSAGDIWFRKESSTQTIIEQWEGLGGTSWSQKTLANAVIANLDAGKLTAGSAFTNALSVKTNFTLGDASTNGVIQSHNFAGSSVGIYLDKFGLVAKGGSLASAAITSSSFTTGAGAFSITINASAISWGTGAYIQDSGSGLTMTRGGAAALVIGASGSDFFGPVDFNGGALNDVSSISRGGGDIDIDATIKPDECYLTTTPVTTGGEAVFMGSSGRLFAHAEPSLLAYKDEVRRIHVDLDALATVEPITWRYKDDVPFDLDDPTATHYGLPADPLVLTDGLAFLTSTNAAGIVSVKRDRLPLALLAGFNDHHPRIAQLEQTAADQAQQIAGLIARIEELETS